MSEECRLLNYQPLVLIERGFWSKATFDIEGDLHTFALRARPQIANDTDSKKEGDSREENIRVERVKRQKTVPELHFKPFIKGNSKTHSGTYNCSRVFEFLKGFC